mmetsp:Transcript_75513/g.219362  ORF Transcript_75513/g.219362 Transcript_75513/m.219362 type:complete len:521 (+) Transcript_75513:122-1684(+)
MARGGMRHFGSRCRDLARSEAFTWSMGMGLFSGVLSAVLRYLHERQVVNVTLWVPDIAIFGFFITFASLVAAFRTANALGRYTDAAAYLHRLGACWYDSASTLFAFCRASDASEKDIDDFQQLIVRLMSLLSAFCLQTLQSSVPQDSLESFGFRFEILGSIDLDEVTQQMILQSTNKVEFIFQMIQQLVVDAQKSGVLSIPPPILTRSYQELGTGLVTFHEAKKLACVPIPFAYVLITGAILITEAFFVPFMIAINTKGVLSSFVFSFGATFLIWFMNGVADALDNPFNREARSLDASSVQNELNEHLLQLLRQARAPPARLVRSTSSSRIAEIERNRASIATWARTATVKQVAVSGKSEEQRLALGSRSSAEIGNVTSNCSMHHNFQEDPPSADHFADDDLPGTPAEPRMPERSPSGLPPVAARLRAARPPTSEQPRSFMMSTVSTDSVDVAEASITLGGTLNSSSLRTQQVWELPEVRGPWWSSRRTAANDTSGASALATSTGLTDRGVSDSREHFWP